ncbi:hypothetical protein B0H34DRAFT_709443 [Crassisporium funariophilum]|nr:hypothetical protein B0H34DRAFT_727117 [Crassisporium funariophilum]KAF8156514.1 hypothetical protein B0H34DRAFT_709443 [Crassisporium funariophilum]
MLSTSVVYSSTFSGLTLCVGDPVSTTTLTATPGPLAPSPVDLLAPTIAISGGGGGVDTSLAPSLVVTSTASGGGGMVATAVAAQAIPTVSAASKAAFPCVSCAAAGCVAPAPLASVSVAATVEDRPGTSVPMSENPHSPINVSDTESIDAEEDPTVRWYAVTRGRHVGVFCHWHSVAPLVVSVSGACYSRYSTRNLAIAAFACALNAGAVSTIN